MGGIIMAGYVIHLAVGKAYIKNNSDVQDVDKFLEGTIMPDMLQKPQSHFGDDTAKPGLDAFVNSHPMSSDFNKGYFLHLITDYLFYNKYLENFEWTPDVYDDYDRLNKILMERYNIQIPDEIKSVVQFKDDELKVFNLESICKFIETVGKINIDELIQNRKYDSVYDKSKEDDYEK